MLARALLASIALLLAACGAAPVLKDPPAAAATVQGAYVPARMPDAKERYLQFSQFEGKYFGASNSTMNVTGAVAIGLLFGPIGVVANMERNKAINERLIIPLGSVTQQDLGQILRTEASLPVEANSAPMYELVPSANIHFSTETQYRITCVLVAHLPQPPGEPWRAVYATAEDEYFDSSKADDTERAIASLPPCLRNTYSLFKSHVSGTLGQVGLRSLTYRGGITVNATVVVPMLPDRVVIKSGLGIQQLAKDQVGSLAIP